MTFHRDVGRQWSAVMLFGLLIYALAGETLHFFNHFFPGVALGVVILLILTLVGTSTEQYQFSIPFFTYLYAIIPEFIWIGRTLFFQTDAHHAHWENVFLFHITLDHWLEQTELVLPVTAFLLAGVLYAYSVVRRKNNKVCNSC